ncbi:hypothetical protein ABZ860_30665 [Microbispora sp. NPDC046973]
MRTREASTSISAAVIGPLGISYNPPAVTNPALRRRPAGDRATD